MAGLNIRNIIKKQFILLFIFVLFSCKESVVKNDKQTLDFGAFTIEAPKNWTMIKQQGIDSYVGEISISLTDTIGFDLGAWSNTLTEQEPVILERSSLKYFKKVDTTQIVMVDDHRGIDPDKYRKQNLTWDTIDGREAKIVYPRKPGYGITGVYIDSLWTSKYGVEHFNLYGENLEPENQKVFLNAMKTLKFHQSK